MSMYMYKTTKWVHAEHCVKVFIILYYGEETFSCYNIFPKSGPEDVPQAAKILVGAPQAKKIVNLI